LETFRRANRTARHVGWSVRRRTLLKIITTAAATVIYTLISINISTKKRICIPSVYIGPRRLYAQMALIKSGKYVARRVVLIGEFRLTNLWTCIIVEAVNVDTAINRFENCKSLRPGFYVLWHLGNSKLTHNMNAHPRSRFYSHRRGADCSIHPTMHTNVGSAAGRAVNWTVLFKQNIAYCTYTQLHT